MTGWESVGRDIRIGVRALRRSPGYALAVILILTVGIGANAAMFSAIEGVLLKPLPFRSGHELVVIQQSAQKSRVGDAGVSIPEIQDYRTRLQSVNSLVEYHGMSFTLLNQGEPDRVDTGVVSARFFDMLGVQPLIGRTFVPQDDEHGADAVLVLSHQYWLDKFGGDSGVVGKAVEMNNRIHTIVGVLPEFPQYPRENDVYMPTSACPFRDNAGQQLPNGHRSFAGLRAIGRLNGMSTARSASAEIAGVAATFERDYPSDYRRAAGMTGRAIQLDETLVGTAQPMLLALSGTTLLVLIIACANVANLSLARMAYRRREFALRAALGAGRATLLRQQITESVILSVAGGALGVGLAWLSRGMLASFIGRFSPRAGQISIDGTVLLFALGVSLATGIVFGAVPVLLTRRDLMSAIREGGQGGGHSGKPRVRAALVVAQVATSFVLLLGAALLLQSLQRMYSVNLGYDTRQVMTAAIFGNFTTMGTGADAQRIQSAILDRLRASPGVVSAAVTSAVPLSNIQPGQQTIRIENRASDEHELLQVDPGVASEGYFETLNVPLLAGRTFRESDTRDTPRVAVINRSMAQYWKGTDPIGSRFAVEGAASPAWLTVIGVVADARLYGADRDVQPQYYSTYRQTGGNAGRLLVRAAGDASSLIPVIKEAVHGVDPTTPVEELQTLETLKNGRLLAPGVTAALLAMFAGVAWLVSLAGIAGLVGTSVSRRTREFGLRMALGASRQSVLRVVVAEGLGLTVIGIAFGVVGGYVFSRIITRLLYATNPSDLITHAAVALVFLIAALAASLGPARRATTIDPMIALRSE
jgi:putative ABC transport system permease protein